MNPADRVLFVDVMDTLVVDPIHHALPSFFGMTRDAYYQAVDRESWRAFERGTLPEAGFLDQMFLDRRGVDGEGLRQTLRSSYRWVPGMQPLLERLRQHRTRIYALSNYPPWWRLIEDRLQLSRYLHWDFVSCRTGHRKPAPEAFLKAAGAVGLPPGACLFIDDRIRNCLGAQAVGMAAHRFLDAVTLEDALHRAGLLV